MLPTNSPPATSSKKRKSEVTLNQIRKIQDDQIQKELDCFQQVKKLFDNANDKSASFALARCYQHILDMNGVLTDIRGKVIISFFAKPGYGKSFTINNIISGFNKRYDTPLPSGDIKEKGLTSTVIDVQYGKQYKLEKVMCTHDEYLLRLKLYNSKLSQPSQYGSNTYHYQRYSEPIDEPLSEIDELSMLDRAKTKIAEFEEKKQILDCLTVKKLILHLPSEYLRDNNIILRDMPGYDDNSNSGLFSQYIKESMEDTCILISGLENCRSIYDIGLVKKYWDYGIYSPKQLFPPSIVIGINDKSQKNEKYESLDLKSSFDKMKKDFRDGLANVFNVEIEGAELIKDTSENEETNIIEDKYSFVKGLNDSFAVLVFPPIGHKSEEFERQFSTQVEQARIKIIDKNCETLRDIAIIILTNILSKLKDNDTFSKEMQKKLLKVREKISEELSKRVEQTKTVSPTFEILMDGNHNNSTPQFITSLTNFFKRGIDGCFNKSDLEDMLNKFEKTKFKKEDKKKEWIEVFQKFKTDFLLIIEIMKTKARDLSNNLHTFLVGKRFALEARLNEEFVKNLIRTLVPKKDEESPLIIAEDTLIDDIYEEIVNYENQLTEYLKDTKKIDTLSATEKEQVKNLLEEYKQKRPQSQFLEITMNSKLHNPQPAPSNLKLPSEESDNVSQLKQKGREYVATIDPVVGFSLEKMEKSNLVVEKVDLKYIEDNEIQIGFDRNNKKLQISYSKQLEEKCSEFEKIKKNGKGQDAKEKKLSEIKLAPIFLVTRPRGPWNPNLMVDDILNLTENNVKFLFFIVTEQCYVERYKKKLKENGADTSKYNFLILNSDSKLGYARVETCIFQTCEHLQFETCIIMHDDIRLFYEYLPDQKVTTTHKYAMARSCLQLEDTLYEELFEPKQTKETIEKLETVITPQSLKSLNFISLAREVQNRCTGLTEEQLNEQCIQITDYFGRFKQNDSRENALKEVAQNPNQCIEYCKMAKLKDLAVKIEEIFDRTKHVGRVSLYDFQTKPDVKNKVLGLSKPTHILSNSKSSAYIYYIPAMKGIHSISDEEFWKIPDDKDRKEMLKKFVATKKKSKQNSYHKLGAKTALKGYRYSDIALKTQMLLHGVGSFQLFSFAYSSNPNAPSLNDYKDTNRGETFNSDTEEENLLAFASSKKRKRNSTSPSPKKTKK